MRQPIQVLVYVTKVVEGERQYLMMRRVASRDGFWQGVTGGVEEGEERLDAALRELSEETNFVPIDIQLVDYCYSFPIEDRWRHMYAEGVEEITESVFVAQVDGQNDPVIDPSEHDQWQWCGFKAALALLIWPGNIEALKRCEQLLTES